MLEEGEFEMLRDKSLGELYGQLGSFLCYECVRSNSCTTL